MVIRMVVVVLIVVGVASRIAMLSGSRDRVAATAGIDRGSLAAELAKALAGSQAGSMPGDAIRPLCFDADAAIVLSVGADGQPGRRNQDDNRNGVVDDSGEIGAVGSDDRCAGPLDEGYDAMSADPHSIVISRGGFVECDDGQPATRYLTDQWGWFVAQ